MVKSMWTPLLISGLYCFSLTRC
uniref:Uncharacterized protein n=1 Tax=Anguilla anguilla TaxID=7936 RepID=A0A0E9XAR1_ANGAN